MITLDAEPATAPPLAVFPPPQDAQAEDITLRIPSSVRRRLVCPACRESLAAREENLTCTNLACQKVYPIADGTPILIDADESVFSPGDFLDRKPTFFKPTGRFRGAISRCLPDLSGNVASKSTFARMARMLKKRATRPRLLVIGGSIAGAGMADLLGDEKIEIIETDAALGPRTQLICDAHQLPLADRSVHGVIVQAVLEHVVDPHRCVAEIHRVLTAGGLVYADTPFMQQVHGREYDFTRFTRLGHRRLFRNFREIESGISGGPGSALAWSIKYFLLSFFTHARWRALASGTARATLFWLKYLDRYLANKSPALDAAAAFYLLAEKSDETLSDRELLDNYRGGF